LTFGKLIEHIDVTCVSVLLTGDLQKLYFGLQLLPFVAYTD